MKGKIILAAVATVATVVGSAGIWLAVAPPELIRVGANYSAKIVCSNVFLAGRDAQAVLADDVQAPGHPILRVMRVAVDKDAGTVRAGLFGLFGKGLAVYRPGTGCASVPDGDLTQAAQHAFAAPPAATPAAGLAWPRGDAAEPRADIQALLARSELTGPGARALVVIHKGKLVGEHYAPGFDARTPLLGWSMTKTVTAALVGMAVADDKLALERQGFWPGANGRDERARIRLADLLAMSSGLRFNEEYGDVSDVTRMLYLEPDMAAFVHGQPLDHPVGSVWNYSSGTTVLLSRLLQQAVGAPALDWPQRRLFGPLGMRGAVLEADARGTFVGSSYLYATAQDWARFAQFLLQDGMWEGQRLLPEGYVEWMRQVAPASGGEYGQGQLWRHGPDGKTPDKDPDRRFGLPADTFWMLGHDGQSIAVVPSAGLVLVRLGLTPARLGYQPQALLVELLKSLQAPAKGG